MEVLQRWFRFALIGVTLLAFTHAAVAADLPNPAAPATEKNARPLKVFILAGQSNMQGHARISTFDSMADDPRTAPLLREMLGPDGKPRVCEKVWISSVGSAGDGWSDVIEQTGKLTAGFGASPEKIGPEFTFGLTMEKHLGEPILIIKTAWGGRNLHTDFRPPSAGPETFSEYTREQWKKRGLDVDQESAKALKNGGVFYRHMIDHVKKTLRDIRRVVPDYDPAQGYELAGFVWFQGFNDMIDDWTYHDRKTPGGYDPYAELLGQLIRDVRKDLAAPKMPFVIGVMGIGGLEEGKKPPQSYFRKAQAAPASLPEFKGNVVAVETAPFWDDDLEALQRRSEILHRALDQKAKKTPNWSREARSTAEKQSMDEQFTSEERKRLKGVSNGGYHYLGASKILAPIGNAFAEAIISLNHTDKARVTSAASCVPAEMAGYLIVPHSRVPGDFNAGFSMYVAAWPLLKAYPGENFQSGLFGTWMFAQFDGQAPKKHYSDIEGGLGWWRDTRFATETPKFIMGGVALNFSQWANGPGAGKGRNWNHPAGHYAIAQLSPWVLWPPDGLNLKQGTRGELFGYGYLPLPLTTPKTTTAGKDVPTGNQCWTLFLNTGNFKGPVTFFLPYFWSRPSVENPGLSGLFLDTRPSEPNRAIQMETQHIPAYLATDGKEDAYVRIAPTVFPGQSDAPSVLIHRSTAYSKAALWDRVQAWFDGGPPASGEIDPTAAVVHKFDGTGRGTWEIRPPKENTIKKAPIAWNSLVTPVAIDEFTYGYRWAKDVVTNADTKDDALVTLPQYYRMETDSKGRTRWVTTRPEQVPSETGLARVEFPHGAIPPLRLTSRPTTRAVPGRRQGRRRDRSRPGSGTAAWSRIPGIVSLTNPPC